MQDPRFSAIHRSNSEDWVLEVRDTSTSDRGEEFFLLIQWRKKGIFTLYSIKRRLSCATRNAGGLYHPVSACLDRKVCVQLNAPQVSLCFSRGNCGRHIMMRALGLSYVETCGMASDIIWNKFHASHWNSFLPFLSAQWVAWNSYFKHTSD